MSLLRLRHLLLLTLVLLPATAAAARYIIELDVPDRALAGDAQSAAVSGVVTRVSAVLAQRGLRHRSYQTLPYVAVEEGDIGMLSELKGQLAIKAIFPDRLNQLFLAQSLPLIHQQQAELRGASGKGQAIAVLDTGADYRYVQLGGCRAPGLDCRVVHSFDAAPDDGRLDDVEMHGTNVAAIAAAVAPQAKIVAIDVFGAKGALDSDVLAALDWVNTNRTRFNIGVINMSFGDPEHHYPEACDGQVAYDSAFRILRRNGVMLVAAAGNEAKKDGIASPACHSQVIAVGATTDADAPPTSWKVCRDPALPVDRVACFSNSAQKLDVLAPGVNIAAGPSMSGTSQASPHVAGAIAAIKSALPSLSAEDIALRLRWTGKPVEDRNGLVRPRLDMVAVLDGRLDQAPLAKDDVATASQGGGVMIAPLSNDVDESPEDLVLVSHTQPGGARVVRNDKSLYVLVKPDAVGDQVFGYTIRDTFGRFASAKVTVKVVASASPGGRVIPSGPPRWSDMVRLNEEQSMILWSEGSVGHMLQCLQSVNRDGDPTSGTDTCRQIDSDGINMTAASAGNGKYVVSWHERVNEKMQLAMAIHDSFSFGKKFIASTPNTFGAIEELGAPAVAAWPDKVMALWPEWPTVSTFFAMSYANVNSSYGGVPLGDRATLFKNLNLPSDHRILPRPDGSFIHIVSRFRDILMMAYDANGKPLWPTRAALAPARADVLGFRLNSYQAFQLADGGFAIIWSDGLELASREDRVWFQRYGANGAATGAVRRLHAGGWKIDDLTVAAGNGGATSIGWRETNPIEKVSVLATMEIGVAGDIRIPARIDYWTAAPDVFPHGLRLNLLSGERRHLLWREGPIPASTKTLRAKILP